MASRRNELRASAAVLATGLLWGIYWLPLRTMEAAGLSGPWATFAPMTAGLVMLAPIALVRWRRLIAGGCPLFAVGVLSGSAFVLYSDALLMTEVVTATLLFYLTPVWSTLLARVVLGQSFTPTRVVTIVLGIGGMAVILGSGGGLPLPRNAGDWLGLVSGMVWAVASVGIRKGTDVGAIENTFAYLVGGTAIAAAAPLVVMSDRAFAFSPAAVELDVVLPLLVAVAVVWFIISIIFLMWGNTRIDPGRVGILLMSEVLIATLTAAVLTDEPFGWRQIIGGVLIIAAAAIDIMARAPEPALPAEPAA